MVAGDPRGVAIDLAVGVVADATSDFFALGGEFDVAEVAGTDAREVSEFEAD